MKVIKELSKIITPKRSSHISILSFDLKKDSKLLQLYEGVRKNKFESDEEAITAIYGAGGTKNKYKFSKLKYDLRKRMFNTLHLIETNPKELDETKKVVLECERAWTAIRHLIMFQSIRTAIYVLNKHFQKMLDHELTMMIIEGAKLYRKYYSSVEASPKKVAYYDEIITQYLRLYVSETQIEGYFSGIVSLYINDRSHKSEVELMADKYLSTIRASYPAVESSAFLSRYKLIEIFKYMSQYNYEKTAQICEEALLVLEQKEVKRSALLMTIHSQYISCLTHLGRYEAATIQCRKVLNTYLVEGEFNWFKIKELEFQNLLYAEAYQEAYQLFRLTTAHKRFKQLPPSFTEEWTIYRAYLAFLNITSATPISNEQMSKHFRLSRFLNDVPNFSKDKQGLNIAILVCHIVILTVQEKYDQVFNRIEAIEKYTSRHLKSDYHFRTKLFLKVINILSKGGFDTRMVNWQLVDKLKQKMSENPLEIINPIYSIEIIRYEKIIDLLINYFKVNKTNYPIASRQVVSNR